MSKKIFKKIALDTPDAGDLLEPLGKGAWDYVKQKFEKNVDLTRNQEGLSLQEFDRIISMLSNVIPEFQNNPENLKNYLGKNGFFANPQEAIKTLTGLYKFINTAKIFVPKNDLPNLALNNILEMYQKTNNYQEVNSYLADLTEQSRSFANNVYLILKQGDPNENDETRKQMGDLAALITVAKKFGQKIDVDTLTSIQKIINNNVIFFGEKSKDFNNFSVMRDAVSMRQLANLQKSLAQFNLFLPSALESEKAAKDLSIFLTNTANSKLGKELMKDPLFKSAFETLVALEKLKQSLSLGQALDEAKGKGFK